RSRRARRRVPATTGRVRRADGGGGSCAPPARQRASSSDGGVHGVDELGRGDLQQEHPVERGAERLTLSRADRLVEGELEARRVGDEVEHVAGELVAALGDQAL